MCDDPQQVHDTSLEELEVEVHKRTIDEFGPPIDLARRMLTFMLRRLGEIGPVSPTHDAPTAYVFLVIRSFNALRCAYALILRGYYVPAVPLMRAALEDWFMCKFLEVQPEAALALFEQMDWRPKIGNMATQAKVRDIYDSVYSDQSRISHPRSLSLWMLVDHERKVLRLGPHFDWDIATIAFGNLFLGINLTMEIVAWVINTSPAATGETGREGGELMDEANAWVSSVRHRNMASDVKGAQA